MGLQNVSVLFTDMVGSTALATSVDPERADELRREHFAVLRRAIADADGTEVKNLGDGLMVVLPTASAALACAVSMQQGTEVDNRSRDLPFGLRVGVSTGEAVEEDGDYFGDPVVEAARLCARCDAGQILATDVVKAMAGRRTPFGFASSGDLELKGLPLPVPTVEVLWDPVPDDDTAPDRVPLPSILARAPRTGVVGRAEELAGLLEATKRVAAGNGREVVVIAGEAGLGKTTLVAEVARTAFAEGACVLFGHAEEDLATPYGLFVEAFGHLITHLPESDLIAHVEEFGPDLARLVTALCRRLPELDLPVAGADVEDDRFRLFAAALGLVRRVAAAHPVVLVLDDLQWADEASLQLLRHIATQAHALDLLVLGTYRDTEITVDHALTDTLAALWRVDGASRVNLRGLDDSGVISLLEAVAGHGLSSDGVGLARSLYRETDGNPFFLAEILRDLAETGAIYQDGDGRWVTDGSLSTRRLPDSVREVVGARVARLGPEATRVLTTAAVIGRDFDLDLLTRAADLDDDAVLDILDDSTTAALVREPTTAGAGRFTFAHATIQRTLYHALSPSRRARAHQRVAEALEDLTSDHPDRRIGELAHHWAHAVRPTDTSKAVDAAARAGELALAQLAPADALRWYSQALELHDSADDHRRAQLLLGRGTAQQLVTAPEFRETLLEAARLADATDDTDLLARAAIANYRGFVSNIGTSDTDRLAVIDRALERLGDTPTTTRARLLVTAAVERTYLATVDERLALAEEAVEIVGDGDDPIALVDVVTRACQCTIVPWTLEHRTRWARLATDAAAGLRDPRWRWRSHQLLRLCLMEAADGAGVEEQTLAIEKAWAELQTSMFRWASHLYSAMYAILYDRLEEAEQQSGQALEVGIEVGFPDAFPIFSAQVANLHEVQGRFGELVPALEDLTRDHPGMPIYRAVLTQALVEAGDLDRARDLFEHDRDAGFPMTEEFSWTNAHMQWAKVAIALDDLLAAGVLHERLVPYADQIVTTHSTVSPSVAHYLGRLEHLLGRHDDADASFARAHTLHQRVRAPGFVARTEVRWAALLADRGLGTDHDRARVMATRARDLASTRPGWEWIARDATSVLDQLT